MRLLKLVPDHTNIHFLKWRVPFYIGSLLLMAQLALMVKLMRDPKELAPWYNATGTSLYVIGMLITAFALRSLLAGVS